MSLDMFASQRSGIEQSMTSTIISSIIGQLTQQGSQNYLMGGNLEAEEESNQPFQISVH